MAGRLRGLFCACSHFPLARAALLAGKAVIVDKPFTVTLSEAEELVLLARGRNALLSVFHNRRFDSDYLSVAAHIRAGRLGEEVEFISRYDRFDPTPRDRWREQGAKPGSGLWYDLGPHLVDQSLQLFGAPVAVSADMAALRGGADAVDFASVTLIYEQPARRVLLHCTRVSALPGPRFEVHGLRGSIICADLDVQEDQLKAGMQPGAPGWGVSPKPLVWRDCSEAPPVTTEVARLPGDYTRYYAAVVEALRSGGPNPVPPEEALLVQRVIEAAIVSARERRVVPFVVSA